MSTTQRGYAFLYIVTGILLHSTCKTIHPSMAGRLLHCSSFVAAHQQLINSSSEQDLCVQNLLTITGSLDTNRRDAEGYNGFDRSLASAQQHGLEHEVLTGDEVNARFPGYNLPSNFAVSQLLQQLQPPQGCRIAV